MMSNGIDMIAKERAQQVEREGWSAVHDDTHNNGELAMAAACYAASAAGYPIKAFMPTDVWGDESCGCRESDCPHRMAIPVVRDQWRDPWPWHDGDKRGSHDRLRKLVIAGALIAAEIDRLGREPTDEC